MPEPRELSLAFSVMYAVALATGVAALVWPPLRFAQEVGGRSVMASIGALFIIGALLAMYGGMKEHWKLERIGLWFIAGALLICGIILVVLQISSGDWLVVLGVTLLAMFSLLVRYLMIWRFTFRPRA